MKDTNLVRWDVKTNQTVPLTMRKEETAANDDPTPMQNCAVNREQEWGQGKNMSKDRAQGNEKQGPRRNAKTKAKEQRSKRTKTGGKAKVKKTKM